MYKQLEKGCVVYCGSLRQAVVRRWLVFVNEMLRRGHSPGGANARTEEIAG